MWHAIISFGNSVSIVAMLSECFKTECLRGLQLVRPDTMYALRGKNVPQSQSVQTVSYATIAPAGDSALSSGSAIAPVMLFVLFAMLLCDFE